MIAEVMGTVSMAHVIAALAGPEMTALCECATIIAPTMENALMESAFAVPPTLGWTAHCEVA